MLRRRWTSPETAPKSACRANSRRLHRGGCDEDSWGTWRPMFQHRFITTSRAPAGNNPRLFKMIAQSRVSRMATRLCVHHKRSSIIFRSVGRSSGGSANRSAGRWRRSVGRWLTGRRPSVDGRSSVGNRSSGARARGAAGGLPTGSCRRALARGKRRPSARPARNTAPGSRRRGAMHGAAKGGARRRSSLDAWIDTVER